jgi:hypothetical protein
LQKWQSNLVVEAIQGAGLDPRQFDLADDDGEIRIKHKWSPSRLTIRSEGAFIIVFYVVGDGPEWPIGSQTWLTIPPRIDFWLKEVRRDLETPDLWAELQRDDRLLFRATFDDVTENASFPPDEQNKIATRLRALGEHAERTYSLSAAQMRVLDRKLDYLVNAARRLGRKDWLNVCAGAILGLILAVALPPEAARGMLLGLLQTIGHLYGFPELPMLPC